MLTVGTPIGVKDGCSVVWRLPLYTHSTSRERSSALHVKEQTPATEEPIIILIARSWDSVGLWIQVTKNLCYEKATLHCCFRADRDSRIPAVYHH